MSARDLLDTGDFYGSGNAPIANCEAEGNMIVEQNNLFGGGAAMRNVNVRSNYIFGGTLEICYSYKHSDNEGIVVEDNYLIGKPGRRGTLVEVRPLHGLTFRRNIAMAPDADHVMEMRLPTDALPIGSGPLRIGITAGTYGRSGFSGPPPGAT